MDTYLSDKHFQCLMSDQDVKRVLTFCEPIDVGILYDPIKDIFLPKLQLDKRLVNPIRTTRKESKEAITLLYDDTISDRLDQLDCTGDQRLGLLVNRSLANIGASTYLLHPMIEKASKRIIIHYTNDARIEYLRHWEIDPGTVERDFQLFRTLPNGENLHLVVAVMYGCDAFCVLEHKLTNEAKDDEQDDGDANQHFIRLVQETRNVLENNDNELIDVLTTFDNDDRKNITAQMYQDTLISDQTNDCMDLKRQLDEFKEKCRIYPVTKYALILPLKLLVPKTATSGIAQTNHYDPAIIRRAEAQCHELFKAHDHLKVLLTQYEKFGITFAIDELTYLLDHLAKKEGEFFDEIKATMRKPNDLLKKKLEQMERSAYGRQQLDNIVSFYTNELKMITQIYEKFEKAKIPHRSWKQIESRTSECSRQLILTYDIYRYRSLQLKQYQYNRVDDNGIVWFEKAHLIEDINGLVDQFINLYRHCTKAEIERNQVDFAVMFDVNREDAPVLKQQTATSFVQLQRIDQLGDRRLQPTTFPSNRNHFQVVNRQATSIKIRLQINEANRDCIRQLSVKLAESSTSEKKHVFTKFGLDDEFESKIEVTLTDLKPNTSNRIQVFMHTVYGNYPFFEDDQQTYVVVNTLVRLRPALVLQKTAKQVADRTWQKKSILIPNRVEGDDEVCKRLTIGKRADGRAAYDTDRVIMFVGGTGHGKSTLISSMINYLYQVEIGDEFRFRLVSEEEETEESGNSLRTVSKTKKVTAYVLEGTILKYRLHIVDSPGFGDTTGFTADQRTQHILADWLKAESEHGLDRLDAICLVVKSSESRLTRQTKYELAKVMDLFAWDTKHNIIPLLTFSDWSDYPPAIDALHEAKLGINVDPYFNFNASAMFECVEDDPIRREQWEKSMNSFKDLFEEIEKKEAISVKLTKDVCEKRGKLEKRVAQLHKSIRREMDQVSAMRNVYVSLKQYESEKDRSKDFITTTNKIEYKQTPIPGNQHTTNCEDCKSTCHDNCSQSNDADKMRCSMMDQDGNCTVCRCNWQKHKNLPYIFEAVTVEESQTNQNLEQTHRDAEDKLQQIDDELKSMAHKLIEHDKRIKEHIENIRITQDELDKIAIRKTTSSKKSTISYIEMMIATEEQSMDDNAADRMNAVDRIAALNKQLKMAKLVEESNNPSFDPLAIHCANDSALLNYLAERYGMDEFKNRVLTREATTTRSTEDDDDDDGDVDSANTL